MVAAPPVVAVHLVVLYEAVCHSCDWSLGPVEWLAAAEIAASRHVCELEETRTPVRSDIVAGDDSQSNASLKNSRQPRP